jgi:hypothetical protein
MTLTELRFPNDHLPNVDGVLVPSSIWFNLSQENTERAGIIGGWNVRGGTHTLCDLFVDGVGWRLDRCVG